MPLSGRAGPPLQQVVWALLAVLFATSFKLLLLPA